MNVRAKIAHGAYHLARQRAAEKMKITDRVRSMSRQELEEFQQNRLTELLKHSYETVPYYQEILESSGVISDGTVQLENFTEIPLLTKEELRSESDRLRSTDSGPDTYTDTSGGTTGEPVKFVQDGEYDAWNHANHRLCHQFAGRELGEPWVRLWGSERDLFDDGLQLRGRLVDFVLNRHTLNSYHMGEEEMTKYVERINEVKPYSIEAYVESINVLSKHIEREELDVHSPRGILSTAGTLHPSVRKRVEDVFDTAVLNKYGSREIGDVACECPQQEGLHVFSHTHYVEIVGDNAQPVAPGEEGRLAITLLTNYTMPLIRYEIGDMAVKSESECSCDRPLPTIGTVTGRVTDHFVTTDGKLVYPGYLRKQLYHESWMKKYQIRQTETDRVVYRVVLNDGKPSQDTIDNITTKTQSLLGEEMTVKFEYVDHIEASESGKFRYTISEVVNE